MRPLQPGDIAPSFTVTDVRNEQPVALEQLLGDGRYLLIGFHRFASCPFCNYRIHELLRRYDRYRQAGLRTIAFFESSAEHVRTGAERLRVSFPMAADPGLEVYGRYSVGATSIWGTVKSLRRVSELRRGFALTKGAPDSDGAKTRLPADFLIGPDGRIKFAHYGADIGDHMPFTHIEAALGFSAEESKALARGAR